MSKADELSERSIRIKELIHEEVCMGTYGLVELELKEFDKEIKLLKQEREKWEKELEEKQDRDWETLLS